MKEFNEVSIKNPKDLYPQGLMFLKNNRIDTKGFIPTRCPKDTKNFVVEYIGPKNKFNENSTKIVVVSKFSNGKLEKYVYHWSNLTVTAQRAKQQQIIMYEDL